MTRGFETLTAFEGLETKKEGIFVMPRKPVIIQSSYVYTPGDSAGDATCSQRLVALQERFDAVNKELHDLRTARLPG